MPSSGVPNTGGVHTAHQESCAWWVVCARPLPRERPDQRKRPEAGSNRYAVACVPIMVGIAVPIMVGIMVVIDVSNLVPSGTQEMW
jgi:hypothetical protein